MIEARRLLEALKLFREEFIGDDELWKKRLYYKDSYGNYPEGYVLATEVGANKYVIEKVHILGLIVDVKTVVILWTMISMSILTLAVDKY